MPYDQDIALSSLPMLQNSGIYCLKYMYVSDVVVTGLATAPTVLKTKMAILVICMVEDYSCRLFQCGICERNSVDEADNLQLGAPERYLI